MGKIVKKVVKTVVKTVQNVIKHPLPVIETIALTAALGPEGLALGLDAATTSAVVNSEIGRAHV